LKGHSFSCVAAIFFVEEGVSLTMDLLFDLRDAR